jgi:DNA-binding LytR/AlgR family response regulator
VNKLKIAICDDEKLQLNLLEKYCLAWLSKNKLQAEIASYSSAEAFLFAYEDNKSFDILLLDIQMKELDGISLAKKLRELGEKLSIIFITGVKEFVFEGYHVQATDYILKPVELEKLEIALDRAYKDAQKAEPYIFLQVDNELVKINEKDIMYIESVGHKSIVYSNSDSYEIKKGISSIENELKQNFFYKCHRSFIVNIIHIDSITKTDVKINNIPVPIARGKWEELNKAFLNYYRDKLQ